jgi:hypothetical protein
VPCIPMDKAALMAEIRQRGLRSYRRCSPRSRWTPIATRGKSTATSDRRSVPHRAAAGRAAEGAGPVSGPGCWRLESWRLGPMDQIPVGEGRAFAVGEKQVAVFRPRGGGLHAVRAICPHRGGPLADGLIDAGLSRPSRCASQLHSAPNRDKISRPLNVPGTKLSITGSPRPNWRSLKSQKFR